MVREAEDKDIELLAKHALNIWKSSTFEELKNEFSSFIRGKETAVFVKEVEGMVVGFAQCGLRHEYVEGTHSSPVGYFEGVYVEQAHRRKGYARELLFACEKWSKKMGCKEFASDCEFENNDSQKFHLHSGFEEANRIVCFKKKLK